MTDADGYWAAGLVDGEGCFHLSIRQHGPITASWRFCMTLRADDGTTLHELRSVLGVKAPVRRRPAYRNSKPCVHLTTSNRADARLVATFFRKYQLRSKKRRDFELWAESLDWMDRMLATAPHTNRTSPMRTRLKAMPSATVIQLRDYAQKIRDVREYRDGVMNTLRLQGTTV